jgi:hypothetical protein
MLHVCVEPGTGDVVAHCESTVCRNGLELVRVTAATGEIVLCADPAAFWNGDRAVAFSTFITLRWALRVLDGGRNRIWSIDADIGARRWLLNGYPFTSPFVIGRHEGYQAAEVRTQLFSCSFKAGFSLEEEDGEDEDDDGEDEVVDGEDEEKERDLVGRLDGVEIMRLRRNGTLALMVPQQRARVEDVEVNETFYRTFFCLRAAVRSLRQDYNVTMDTADRTGTTWIMRLMHASVQLRPGAHLPLVGSHDSRKRRGEALRAVLTHHTPCVIAGPMPWPESCEQLSPAHLSYIMMVQQWQLMQMAEAIALRRRQLYGASAPADAWPTLGF